MDRKWLLGLGAAALLVLVVAIAVVFSGGGGGGPADAARAFFAAIPSGGSQAAYDKAAPAFRSATTPDAWSATAAQHNLSQYASSTWDDGGKGGAVVTLNGVLNLKGGGAQPATVRVVKGAGGWSVYSLDLPNGGVAGATAVASAGPASAGAASYGAPPAGVGAAPSGYGGAAPVAPSGAPPDQADSAPTGQPGLSQPGPGQPGESGPPPGYASGGYPPQQGQPPGGVVLNPTRISHDCGPHLLRWPGVQSIDVHCVNGISAVTGARGQCQALVNGRPANVSVTVQSYDPGRDDAELDCRLY